MKLNLETFIFLLTTYEISLSVVFGLLTIFVSLKIINKFIAKTSYLTWVTEKNYAMALFQGTLVICILLMVQNSVLPAVDALRTLVTTYNHFEIKMLLISLAYFLLIYCISFLFSLIVTYLMFHIFIWFNKEVDEMAEIKKNNIPVSILVSFVMLGGTIFVDTSFQNFASGIIDHEALQSWVTPPSDIHTGEQMTPKPAPSPEKQ